MSHWGGPPRSSIRGWRSGAAQRPFVTADSGSLVQLMWRLTSHMVSIFVLLWLFSCYYSLTSVSCNFTHKIIRYYRLIDFQLIGWMSHIPALLLVSVAFNLKVDCTDPWSIWDEATLDFNSFPKVTHDTFKCCDIINPKSSPHLQHIWRLSCTRLVARCWWSLQVWIYWKP